MADQRDPTGNQPDIERIEILLREVTSEDGELVDVPTELFGRIEAELAVTGCDSDVVVDLARRRRFTPRAMAISAAAAVVVIIAASAAIIAQRDESAPTVVASAELAYDAESFDDLGADAAASVSLIDDDGMLRVEINESNLPSPSGEPADLELWLIQPDASGNPAELVSLGLIDPDAPGDFEVPRSHDPDVFFVVDISVEPRDGNTDHSGRSILRGPLTNT